jgi:hypothetical protein
MMEIKRPEEGKEVENVGKRMILFVPYAGLL